jgi:hypothetical protein
LEIVGTGFPRGPASPDGKTPIARREPSRNSRAHMALSRSVRETAQSVQLAASNTRALRRDRCRGFLQASGRAPRAGGIERRECQPARRHAASRCMPGDGATLDHQ